jgi:hypothetical protein
MTSTPTTAGMPGEEAIARALWDSALLQPARGEWLGDNSATEQCCRKAARAVLSLLRPAFEQLTAERDAAIDVDWVSRPAYEAAFARALSAEAKLAQAVEALEPLAKLPLGPEIIESTEWVVYKNAGQAITVGDVLRARSASARGESITLATVKETP